MSDPNQTLTSFKMGIYEVKQLENKIKTINKKIEKLESERDKINANTTISVAFSKYSLDILGLN
jgi:prefoldin subunit 5